MARKLFHHNIESPYHITARAHNKEGFPLPMGEMWDITTDYLYLISSGYGLEVISYALMPNHIHLLCRSPNANLSLAMQYFMREVSRRVNRESGRINQLWGGRFHRCEIQTEHYYRNVYKYVAYNPVKAKLIAKVEDYAFSTLGSVFNQFKPAIWTFDDILAEHDISKTLAWLNAKPNPDHLVYVQSALRKKVFKLAKENNRPNPLEFDTL